MKLRSNLARLVLPVLTTLTLVAPIAAASGPAAPSGVDGGATIDAIFIAEGYDNINFGNRLIFDLHGPTGCTASVSDRDYAIRDLGYNNNQLSSMRVRNFGCVIILFDGPNFTGNSVQFQDCPNLGSCSGENIWKRANSVIIT